MMGGMERSRGGDREGGPQADEQRPLNVEVQEQVEVWILNIEKLQHSSIFTPMATVLKREERDKVKHQFKTTELTKGKLERAL